MAAYIIGGSVFHETIFTEFALQDPSSRILSTAKRFFFGGPHFTHVRIGKTALPHTFTYSRLSLMLSALQGIKTAMRTIPITLYHTNRKARRLYRVVVETEHLFAHVRRVWETQRVLSEAFPSKVERVETITLHPDFFKAIRFRLESVYAYSRGEKIGAGGYGTVSQIELEGCVAKDFSSVAVAVDEAAFGLLSGRATNAFPVYLGASPNETPHIIMKALLSPSLEESSPSPAELRSIIYKVLTQLEALHRIGIRHGDIKRDNIMDGLIDLGLSTFFSLPCSQFSPYYLHPTIASELSKNWQSIPLARLEEDTWSLGCALFEKLYGRFLVQACFGKTFGTIHEAAANIKTLYETPRALAEMLFPMLHEHKDPETTALAELMFDLLQPVAEKAESAEELLAKHFPTGAA